MLGKIEDRRRRGRQKIRWLDGITDSNGHEFEQTLEASEGQGSLVCCSPWGSKSQTQLSGRTTTVFTTLYIRSPELIYLLDASLTRIIFKVAVDSFP